MTSPVFRAIVNPDSDPALDLFLHWCDSKGVRPIPLAPADIAVFVKQAQTLGIEKIAATVTAISKAYLSRGFADPTAGGPVTAACDDIAKLAPPRSWPKENWSAFKSLPYALQLCVAKRETERDVQLRRAQNETAEARRELAAMKLEMAAVRAPAPEKTTEAA